MEKFNEDDLLVLVIGWLDCKGFLGVIGDFDIG
jgi:hypothetical protein